MPGGWRVGRRSAGAAGAPGMETWRELLRSAAGRRALELATTRGGRKEGDLGAEQ